MPTRHSRHGLTLSPEYRMVVLRDVYCDAAVNSSAAISEANKNVAASTGYDIYIVVSQDLIRVRADVEIWDEAPDDDLCAHGWAGPLTFDLDCPTGNLQVGDIFGTVITGIDPPKGPGRYAVVLFHRGREQAERARYEILKVMGTDGDDERIADLQRQHSGIEQYLMRIWWQTDLPPDEDDEDL
ncbi:hypothetical protein [Micromonospora globbae]|uniref:Uncharacterized protein n=1 Tax=Micromonospora globbae TaxID=1894969 RepID=A0A420F107_9ACTN|nr:hypothetical protein [Micromonospora globbae]RKF26618.1 hypothetical protein D7I43_14250 [Micromonospora globbae]